MREMNLYQQNLRSSFKLLLLDLILYENALNSGYVFLAGLHCVVTNSVRLVPAYFVGFLLLILIENHEHYVSGTQYNLGYQPLTLFEVLKGLLFQSNPEEPNFEPIFVLKRTKQRQGRNKSSQKLCQLHRMESNGDVDEREQDIVAVDHREFPFSERNTVSSIGADAASKYDNFGV
jgi:hypothetical protein